MMRFKKVAAVFWQIGILFLVSLLGEWITQFLHLPVPGSVVGMILLFGLLCGGILKIGQIQQVSDFLLKHMAFFFVPVAVGLMNYWNIFYTNGAIFMISLSASLFLALVVFRLAALPKGRGN